MQKAGSRSGPKGIAGQRKRHYTFARCGLWGGLRPSETRSNPRFKLLNLRGFCSLRLSVRTPPFHGGESGSIPLGSAISSHLRCLPKQASPSGQKRARDRAVSASSVVADELCAVQALMHLNEQTASRPRYLCSERRGKLAVVAEGRRRSGFAS